MAEATAEYKVIGTRPIRPDGADKVTGRAIYGGDMRLTGMLHGKVLRSPHAHARIKSINTAKAEALPGVKAVVTAQDFPVAEDRIANLGEMAVNVKLLSNNVIAVDKVLYKGHALAAVAATSSHIAEEALGLIEVEYEVLPAVLNVLDAMKEEAPLLHEHLTTTELGQKTDKRSNIANHMRFTLGDPAQGFRDADIVIERDFDTATVHQGYIEPHNATALWNEDGHLYLWTSTQGAFVVQRQTAEILGLSVSKVSVTPCEIGGGFGGKIAVYLEPVAAVLSRKSGRPVKLIMSRIEEFEATGPTPASHIKVKMGVKKDGQIVAAEASLMYEAGAFPGSPVGAGCMCIFSPYAIPNMQVDGYDVVVNKPKTAAYRAPGATNAAFASETVIDELAEKLGLDPLDMRRLNGAKEGDRRVDGPTFPRIGYMETVHAALEHEHYASPLHGPNRGRGVASGFWFNVGFQSTVVINVNADGTVSLVEGSTDIGGTRASIAMQAAETLGIPYEDVRPTVAGTDGIGFTDVTGGSRTTFATGYAAHEASLDVLRQMKERLARRWDSEVEKEFEGQAERASVQITPDDVLYASGVFKCAKDPSKTMTFKDVSAQMARMGGPITGRATSQPRGIGGAFATHIVDVEVDPETGKVAILRYTAIQDVGRAIHPSYAEGQIQGGAVQGIGWALNEEYVYNTTGNMANTSFLDYRMPTTLDLPMIDTVLVEVPNPGHPYGVRGVGEVPIVPPVAAVANAIYRATGKRMTQAPMSPGYILSKLNE
ncbi:MAG: xanthine dehydrogenase family protein molybdopterin-binding subunit [Candidatus Tectomicrobia bacterium]|uniref:Xanthine dehydrogenase family protein molybdopterin-binding subunit n=1 Tax=Tectimicrobiota bacterium TaxID=2528274 RepID=A0A938B103_UNCTE|nr:xanthine dehydrogenase family protein molybdopterin-binding subunit [Candidatus Tectomicrobia bacterium]